MTVTVEDCCLITWAWLLPPVAVFLERGCGCALLINILLCFLGWIPGIKHAHSVKLIINRYDSCILRYYALRR